MTRAGRRVETHTFKDGEWTCMQYQNTVVAKFRVQPFSGATEYEVVLNTDGWWTATTKKRMNQFAEDQDLEFSVYQRNFDWFVQVPTGEIEFEHHSISFSIPIC